jgi:hypothetical protein
MTRIIVSNTAADGTGAEEDDSDAAGADIINNVFITRTLYTLY